MFHALDPSDFNTAWIRVEPNLSPGCSWNSSSPEKNCQYLRNLINGIQARGVKAGIFSNPTYWYDTFRSTTFCPEVSHVPLWYGSDDGSASFSGFKSFGGWKTPAMKMFRYQYNMCGQPSNLDWKP